MSFPEGGMQPMAVMAPWLTGRTAPAPAPAPSLSLPVPCRF